jgi:hypothetical protein
MSESAVVSHDKTRKKSRSRCLYFRTIKKRGRGERKVREEQGKDEGGGGGQQHDLPVEDFSTFPCC